jgi:hypothetical protein
MHLMRPLNPIRSHRSASKLSPSMTRLRHGEGRSQRLRSSEHATKSASTFVGLYFVTFPYEPKFFLSITFLYELYKLIS